MGLSFYQIFPAPGGTRTNLIPSRFSYELHLAHAHAGHALQGARGGDVGVVIHSNECDIAERQVANCRRSSWNTGP
jgi:hypothetical protein